MERSTGLEVPVGSVIRSSLGRLVTYYFLACFTWSVIGLVVLELTLPNGLFVFGVLSRMSPYHLAYPLSYIGLVACVYALVATIWARSGIGTRPPFRSVAIFATMIASVVISIVPGGVLYAFHDMMAGHFPQGAALWRYVLFCVKNALATGWLIIGLSFPFNVAGLALGYWVTSRGQQSVPQELALPRIQLAAGLVVCAYVVVSRWSG